MSMNSVAFAESSSHVLDEHTSGIVVTCSQCNADERENCISSMIKLLKVLDKKNEDENLVFLVFR